MDEDVALETWEVLEGTMAVEDEEELDVVGVAEEVSGTFELEVDEGVVTTCELVFWSVEVVVGWESLATVEEAGASKM